MGDFGNAVVTLLESFGNGLAVIKRLRRRRKETKTGIASTAKAKEQQLNKSLKTDRRDVKLVYDSYAQAREFAMGDGEAFRISFRFPCDAVVSFAPEHSHSVVPKDKKSGFTSDVCALFFL